MQRSALRFLVVLSLALFGCGSTSSGLLDGHTLLEVPDRPGLRTWEGGIPAQIVATGLLVDPVLVAGDGGASDHDALGAALRQVLIERCGAVVPVVSGNAAGVVRVRTAIERVGSGTEGVASDFTFGADLDLRGAVLAVELVQDDATVALFSWNVPTAAEGRAAGRRWGKVEAAFVGFADALRARMVRGTSGGESGRRGDR